MILVCHDAFGNFGPGDEVEVPDGADFDAAFFHVKPETEPEPAPAEPPAGEE